jgi:hypothetical protein
MTALEVVDVALRAVTAYARDDLAERLTWTRRRLLDPVARVLVVGEFKQGKSMLVNALVNAPVCAVDDDVATVVPTEVRYADEPCAAVVEQPDPGVPEVRRRSVPVDRIGPLDGTARLVEIGIPRGVLAGGLCLVDTPGVGGLDSEHGARTLAALPSADAVLLVSDASCEYSAPELEFLRLSLDMCPNVACVLTKIDLYPEWRRIAELDAARLGDIPLIPVSSTLRMAAARARDRALNADSGFPRLIGHLRDGVLADADRLAVRSASHDVLSVTHQLTASMSAELAALRDPTSTAEVAAAAERVEQLRRQSARWQQTLNDGIADLSADIDHDLRERMRTILRDAETQLDDVNPALIADDFTAWLHQRVSSAASANFVWACQRVRWLAGQVAEHFGAIELPFVRQHATGGTIDQVTAFSMPTAESFRFGQKWVTGMRGGYGGTLMVGMASTLAGLTLLNPLSIAAGVLLGRKTVRDERKRLLLRHQADAKAAVRRYVDDLLFQLAKQSRDMLRESQRVLRDHFTGIAEELVRSLSESAHAAQRAVATAEADRERRILDLEAEIGRVEHLAASARELVA